jgi:hypothetical protein
MADAYREVVDDIVEKELGLAESSDKERVGAGL